VRHHPGHSTAFADGRRLRAAAQLRRTRRQHVAGRSGRSRRSRTLLFLGMPIVVGGAGALVMAVVVLALVGLLVIASAIPALVVGTAAFVAVHRRRRRAALRRGGAPGTAPLPARPAAPPRPELVWERARGRFQTLRSEYAAYECDPMAVLRLPALTDVSVPSTGRFVEAFAEAQALETDQYPAAEHGAKFVAAVDLAERAWTAAREAAARIRLSNLSPTERATVERVIKLLTTARDSDNDPERLTAYARARSELAKLDRAGVIHLPHTAQAALDASGRGALPT
jgi:hypothetical protein